MNPQTWKSVKKIIIEFTSKSFLRILSRLKTKFGHLFANIMANIFNLFVKSPFMILIKWQHNAFCYFWIDVSFLRLNKQKGINRFFPEKLMIKKSWVLIGTPGHTHHRHTRLHPPKSGSFMCYLFLMIVSVQKIISTGFFHF